MVRQWTLLEKERDEANQERHVNDLQREAIQRERERLLEEGARLQESRLAWQGAMQEADLQRQHGEIQQSLLKAKRLEDEQRLMFDSARESARKEAEQVHKAAETQRQTDALEHQKQLSELKEQVAVLQVELAHREQAAQPQQPDLHLFLDQLLQQFRRAESQSTSSSEEKERALRDEEMKQLREARQQEQAEVADLKAEVRRLHVELTKPKPPEAVEMQMPQQLLETLQELVQRLPMQAEQTDKEAISKAAAAKAVATKAEEGSVAQDRAKEEEEEEEHLAAARQAAAKQAEDQRVAAEEARKKEEQLLAQEVAAKEAAEKEEEAAATEAAEKEEEQRVAAEEARKKEQRLAQEVAAKEAAEKEEEQRLVAAKEAAEKEEEQRLAAEEARKKEEQRVAQEVAAKEAAKKEEEQRLAAAKEATAEQAEEERVGAEAARKKEKQRAAQEVAANEAAEKEEELHLVAAKEAAEKEEEQRVAAEEARKKEEQRLPQEVAAKEAAENEEEQRLAAAKEAADEQAEEQLVAAEEARKKEEQRLAEEVAAKEAVEKEISTTAGQATAEQAEEERVGAEEVRKKEEQRFAQEVTAKEATERERPTAADAVAEELLQQVTAEAVLEQHEAARRRAAQQSAQSPGEASRDGDAVDTITDEVLQLLMQELADELMPSEGDAGQPGVELQAAFYSGLRGGQLFGEAVVRICQKWGWTDSLPFAEGSSGIVRAWALQCRRVLPGRSYRIPTGHDRLLLSVNALLCAAALPSGLDTLASDCLGELAGASGRLDLNRCSHLADQLVTSRLTGRRGRADTSLERHEENPGILTGQPKMAELADIAPIFSSYSASSSGEIDGRSFTKLCKDCSLVDRIFSSTDADLIFAKVVPKGQRRITIAEFEKALGLIAERRGCSQEDVMQRVADGAGPALEGTKAEAVRFHDDKTTYTGTHARGGPESVPKGYGHVPQSMKPRRSLSRTSSGACALPNLLGASTGSSSGLERKLSRTGSNGWIRPLTPLEKAATIGRREGCGLLENVFEAYCSPGQTEMDGKGFAKLMKDSKIVGTRFTTTDGLQKLNGIGSFWLVCVSVQITGG
ncbi:TTN [Symbiodinium necroappetens]|uniref:TTN protein n=1 Tax=Symbiodinium necroappetens TaxID=1628268 RepID=A0A812U2K2_9DINO|nr:TTN [Symbiodinium necroappetens]